MFNQDPAFEAAVQARRGGTPRLIPHIVGGAEVASGEVLWREDPSQPDIKVSGCHDAPDQVVADAVAAARRAAPEWAALGAPRRAELMAHAATLITEARATEMAAWIAVEAGKTRLEAFVEVEELRVLLDRYAAVGADEDAFADSLAPGRPAVQSRSMLRPFGVFGVISPFNYPTVQGGGPSIAALIAGNTVVMKPSHLGPASAHAFVELLTDAGVPPGVVNIVHGQDDPGKALVAADIDGMVFTGSYAAGMSILRSIQGGAYPRPVIAEMGGSNPVIVTGSADLARAAEGIAISAFGLTGQRCTACSRVVVTDDVHDELVELIAAAADALVVGDIIDSSTFMGPLISDHIVGQFQNVMEIAHKEGRVVAGGESMTPGYFVSPTVVSELPVGHPLTRGELFMPMVTVTSVPDFDAAIEEANATPMGLTAGIYTGSADEARTYLDRAEAGCIDVNVPGAATTGWWPGTQTFGGWKGSGSTGKQAFGRWYVQQFARQRCESVGSDFDLR